MHLEKFNCTDSSIKLKSPGTELEANNNTMVYVTIAFASIAALGIVGWFVLSFMQERRKLLAGEEDEIREKQMKNTKEVLIKHLDAEKNATIK